MTTPSSRVPLPLRNALAALACEALDDADARVALGWLAAGACDAAPAAARDVLARRHLLALDGTLGDLHAAHRDAIAAHAARAATASTQYATDTADPAADPVARTVAKAVALWNARLFFEVHEILEPEWKRAQGPMRQALQGLIQIAVALHHRSHGNERGARSLMREGRRRLASAPEALRGIAAAALLAATATFETGDGTTVPALRRLA